MLLIFMNCAAAKLRVLNYNVYHQIFDIKGTNSTFKDDYVFILKISLRGCSWKYLVCT